MKRTRRSATDANPAQLASSEELRTIVAGKCVEQSLCQPRGAPRSVYTHPRSLSQDAKIEPDRQPFALVDDVDEMRERLSLLERFVNKLPPALTSQSFAELGIESMGPLRREGTDDMVSRPRWLNFLASILARSV